MISLERVVIFETSRVLKSHVFRQHFLLKNLVFGDQKWSIFGPKMVDFWSKKAIQKKDEIFDEIVSQQGVLPPGPVPAPPPEPLPKSRFARSNLDGRTRTRAFRHCRETGRVRPGWHGNGKRVYMKARYYTEFNECSRL